VSHRRIGDVTILDVQGRLTEEDNASLVLRAELSALVLQGRTNIPISADSVLTPVETCTSLTTATPAC